MPKPSDIYTWELELKNGNKKIKKDINWNKFNKNKIKIVSFIPLFPNLLPRHDLLVEDNPLQSKIFGRGFVKPTGEGYKLTDWVYCVETKKYKFWLFHNGRTFITNREYDLRI